LHESVSKLIQQADLKVDATPDLDGWHQDGEGVISRAFHEEEDALRQALARFEKTLNSCSLADDLSPEAQTELEAHFQHLEGLLDGVKDITEKKFTKARARLLTKYLWEEISILKNLSVEVSEGKETFTTRLRKEFDPNRLKWLIDVYRQTMAELDQILNQPTQGHSSIQVTIKRGRILETKEELLLAFSELKHLYSDQISRFFLATQELRSYEDLKNQEILDRVQAGLRPERSTIEKILEKTFTKRLISDPKAIAQLSLSLAATSKTTSPIAAHALGATTGLLSTTFALPASAFSIYKIGHSLWRHREASRDLKECQEIEQHAELMVKQGFAMRTNAQKVILATPSEEEVDLAQKTLEQATRLLTVGSDLREKAHLNIEELKSEKQRMKAQVFVFGTVTTSQLATAVSSVGTMLKSLVASFSTTAAATALQWVGVAGAGLGVILGTVGLGIHLKGLCNDQKEIGLLAERSKYLDELNLKMPDQKFLHDVIVIETHQILMKQEELKISQRNHWISIASSTFLVVAGVLGIAALIVTGAVSGGLTFAVIGILVLATVTATAHFFIKRNCLQTFDDKVRRDQEEWFFYCQEIARKIQWYGKDKLHMVEIMKLLEIPEEKSEAFFLNPEVFLKKRYQLILEGRK